MRACNIITLHWEEGYICVLCQAGNVWIQYHIIGLNSILRCHILFTAKNLSSNLSPIENLIETARFEPRTFRVPVWCATNWAVLTGLEIAPYTNRPPRPVYFLSLFWCLLNLSPLFHNRSCHNINFFFIFLYFFTSSFLYSSLSIFLTMSYNLLSLVNLVTISNF